MSGPRERAFLELLRSRAARSRSELPEVMAAAAGQLRAAAAGCWTAATAVTASASGRTTSRDRIRVRDVYTQTSSDKCF